MGPDHGVLGATFKATRALQVASMIAIIGITANFISEMVSAGATPPSVLVAILSIVSATGTPRVICTDGSSGLHCRTLLRHHCHSLFRWHPSFPDQHRHRRSFLDRSYCCLSGGGKAALLSQLYGP